MKCICTGGSGFLGSRLIKKLEGEGHEVVNFDLDQGWDVRYELSYHEPCDVIFHLAGILGTPETFYLPQEEVIRTNILGTINTLNLARRLNSKFVYAGMLRLWHNPYSITKGCAQDYVTMYDKHYHLDTVILTLTNVYGPGQKTEPYKKIVPTFIMNALQGKPLKVYGRQTVDLIHVDDVAEAFLLAAKITSDSPLQIGSGREIKVESVAEKIIELTNSNSPIHYLPTRIGEDPLTRITIDSRPALMLGFSCQVSLEDGLRETIEYYRGLL